MKSRLRDWFASNALVFCVLLLSNCEPVASEPLLPKRDPAIAEVPMGQDNGEQSISGIDPASEEETPPSINDDPDVGGPSGADSIFSNHVESMPIGNVSKQTMKDQWDTRYDYGAEEGRIEVIPGGPGASQRCLKITYPANANQTASSGATWETNLHVHTEELYLAYWVRFDQSFQWVKGGKLPGLGGMPAPFPDNGDKKFRIRLMWREEGKVEFYLHDFGMLNKNGEVPYRHWWDLNGQRRFVKGQWHQIEIHVKLNTPGKLDGVLEGWFDGELAFRDTDSNVGVRAAGEEDRKLNYPFFSNFFGGSSPPESQWHPTEDVFAYFDNFVASRQRIWWKPAPGHP